MNEKYFVEINDAVLAYPSAPYNALTLKEEVFKILRFGDPTKLMYDVIALNGINLSIGDGERVGIIGRNGAGKSSLLKAIAGIYPLQSGRITTQGRIRALFELNIGFEFEATGRENILYRGLLLGEDPAQIRQKEDEIIAFADIGDFIDFPIKTYSTGMLIRLAFAISTSVSGDILLLDETLGAGDASFQKKAETRIGDLIDQSKIVVLVSHNLGAIRSICNRVIVLQNGLVVADGDPAPTIQAYLASVGLPS